MPKLTDINLANSVELNDLVHIARPTQFCGNDCQSMYGSSYKATIGQVLDAGGCCMTAATYDSQTNTLIFYGIGGSNSITFSGNFILFSGGSGSCITNLYLLNILPCTGKELRFLPNVGSGTSVYNNSVSALKYGIYGFPDTPNQFFKWRTSFGPKAVTNNANAYRQFIVEHFTQFGKDEISSIYNPTTRLFLNKQSSTSNNGVTSNKYTFDFQSVLQQQGANFKFLEMTEVTSPRYFPTRSIFLENLNDRVQDTLSFQTLNRSSHGITFGSTGPDDNTTVLKYSFLNSAAFISKQEDSLGLNIISLNGPITFRTGIPTFKNTTSSPIYLFQPTINICGTGTTKGYIGLGWLVSNSVANTSPTSLIDIATAADSQAQP